MNLFRLLSLLAALGCFVGFDQTPANANVKKLTLYSTREAWRIAPVIRAFTAETGIEVAIVHRKDGLIDAIAAEAERSDADVLLVEEHGLLLQAREAGITQPMDITNFERAVPPALRDPDGHWIGLSRYARVVYVSKERVAQTAITYEELAEPKWRGKVCMRSGLFTYNISLLASMIAHHGRDEAKRWLAGLKANLARKPEGNDRAQVKAIAESICDVTIANTYYMAEMEATVGEPQKWAASSRILFPNVQGRGSHVLVSGAALMKHTRQRELAIKLISYLTSEIGQQIYAILQHAFPISADVAASKLAGGGEFLVADPLPLSEIAKLRDEARALVVEVGFDNGPGL